MNNKKRKKKKKKGYTPLYNYIEETYATIYPGTGV